MKEVVVLGQVAVVGLGEPEVAFEDQERMLILGPDRPLTGFDQPGRQGHGLQDTVTGRDPELHPGPVLVAGAIGTFLDTLVADVGMARDRVRSPPTEVTTELRDRGQAWYFNR